MTNDFSNYQQMYDLSETDLSKSIGVFSSEDKIRECATHQFELALCTDFIFHPSNENIGGIIKELCRIAEEVRIFPLQDNQGKTPKELGPLMLALQKKNYGVEVRQVKGSNAMLRIWEQECQLSRS